MDPDALFVYGTLQFPEVLHALIDRVPAHTPAQAPGWRVTALPERVYPGLVPGQQTAAGYLLTGLSPEEWRVLDAFEDPVYELRRLHLTDNRHGWAYVCNPEADTLDEDWSLEIFTAQHLPAYVDRCAAWRQRHEARQNQEQAS
ncbi:gamma-glutamylcyclotransferase family protein [Actinomadura craniellae]|uniref:gamma-glutamylcyclotransferase family protein n=1 Tax=Actinomadura craniellae TaxID=2231787 RepID=UPI001F284344|nr:gamma-glutamylcyclotransferase family protein [Actinomadura craniellae]